MKYFIVKNKDINKDFLAIKDLNYELQQYGLELSEKDLQELRTAQRLATRKYKLVDLDDQIIFTIANILMKSPYVRYDNYVLLIKGFIDTYYACRSRFQSQLYDDEVVTIMFQCYLKNYGEINMQLIFNVLQELEKTI